MEKNSSLKNDFELAKIWNIFLDERPQTDLNMSYFNLDNYAFRMDVLMNNGGFEKKYDERMNQVVKRVNDIILNRSNLNIYLSRERERFKIPVKSSESIEILDFSNNNSINNNRDITDKNQITDKSLRVEEQTKEINCDIVCESNELQSDKLKTSGSCTQEFNSILNFLKNEKRAELKDILKEISQKFTLENIKEICKMDFKLNEKELSLLMETLFEINSSEVTLSYNVSFAFLGILSDYVKEQMNNETQSDLGLSRLVFTLCSNACKNYPRQFVLSCAVNWINLLNESLNEKQKVRNKLFTEFLVKLVKESFEETTSTILLQHLSQEHSNSKWSENVYIVVSSLNEKISNLKFEFLKLIVEKMLIDSIEMKKSSVFSKLLLNVMSKFKTALSNQPISKKLQENKDDQIVNDVSNINNNQKTSTDFSVWLDQIFLIIENNQTILKRSLLNIANSFKTENQI